MSTVQHLKTFVQENNLKHFYFYKDKDGKPILPSKWNERYDELNGCIYKHPTHLRIDESRIYIAVYTGRVNGFNVLDIDKPDVIDDKTLLKYVNSHTMSCNRQLPHIWLKDSKSYRKTKHWEEKGYDWISETKSGLPNAIFEDPNFIISKKFHIYPSVPTEIRKLYQAKSDGNKAVDDYQNRINLAEFIVDFECYLINYMKLDDVMYIDEHTCFMFRGNTWEQRKAKDLCKWLRDLVSDIPNYEVLSRELDKCCLLYEKKLNSQQRKKVLKSIYRKIVKGILAPKIIHQQIPPEAPKFDRNPDLFAFEDKVINVHTFEVMDHHPSLMITKHCGLKYSEVMSYTYDNPIIKEIYEFFIQLFDTQELVEYVLNTLASVLYGRNVRQTFDIWIGVGANGKSLLTLMVKKLFGKYCIDFPATHLKETTYNNHGPTPHLYKLLGTRLAMVSEFNSDDHSKLDTSRIKTITGNDEVTARKLFGEPETFHVTAKLIGASNNMPEFKADAAMIRRIKCIPFDSIFNDNPQGEREYLKDPNLPNTCGRWIPALMFIVLRHAKKIAKNGYYFTAPKAVEYKSKSVIDEADNVRQWFINNTERNHDSNLKLTDAYNAYKDWTKSEGIYKIPIKKKFKISIESMIGKYDIRNGWRGYKLIELEDDGSVKVESEDIGKQV